MDACGGLLMIGPEAPEEVVNHPIQGGRNDSSLSPRLKTTLMTDKKSEGPQTIWPFLHSMERRTEHFQKPFSDEGKGKAGRAVWNTRVFPSAALQAHENDSEAKLGGQHALGGWHYLVVVLLTGVAPGCLQPNGQSAKRRSLYATWLEDIGVPPRAGGVELRCRDDSRPRTDGPDLLLLLLLLLSTSIMSSNTNTTTSAAKKSGEKKPAQKKSAEKKPSAKKSGEKKLPMVKKSGEKKHAQKKPTEKKPTEKKPVEKKPVEKKSAEKKSAEKKSGEKKSGEKKAKKPMPKNVPLVHPGLFCHPDDPKHINMNFGQKMILQRWPKYLYPKHPLFDQYRETMGQNPTPQDIGRLLYREDFPKNFYFFGHPEPALNTDVDKKISKLREKTHKLEPGNTYSIPEVGYFKIDRKIGNNGYAATSKDPRFGKCYVTFEAEGKDKKSMPCQFLDVRFYLSIKEWADIHRKHFLQMHCFGLVPGKYHWAVMELAGPNLNDLFIMCDKIWKKSTVIHVMAQTLQAIHDVQLHHHMHRCIDPSSFVVGVGDKHKVVYVIDFSHSYEFTERTRAQRKGEEYSADTPRVRWRISKRELFAPRSYHTGSPYRRIDDVESWYFMLQYFLLKGLSFMLHSNFREYYYQKCHWMYGGFCQESPRPGYAGVMMSFVRAIDQYDETVNSTVDFPFFASVLENFAVVMEVTKEELQEVEWMPSSKDPSKMVLRGGAFLDPVKKDPTKLATATLILPDEEQKS
uniref:Protein kinase domain-containing protein n=1 Tax=Panagrellus redivivus TaxID=6233 RepID=A0A7E4V6F3_PANRE